MKTQNIQLDITQQDIEEARLLRQNQGGAAANPTLACPACFALQRVTHSPWKILNTSTVMQVDAPFRLGHVPDDLKQKLQQFRLLGQMEPGCFAMQLDQGLELPSS